VQNRIRNDIVSGRLAPEARLKTTDLAARYGVSAIPVREALQRLEGEGLVVITPNRGARVRTIDEEFVRNILDIQRLLDPYMVRWFAESASPEDLVELEAIQSRAEQAARDDDFTAFDRENRRFHSFIYGRHFNTQALRIVHLHEDLLFTLSQKYPANHARMLQSCGEHRAFIDAVRSGQAGRATAAMTTHISRSSAYILARLRRAGATHR
jgi:DNA-binding GntR family transcriptional regulator